jgi:hypothetical protein
MALTKTNLANIVEGILPVANGGTGSTTSTGSGALVLATSPTLVTPVLGTPSSGTLTNCTFPTLNQNTTGTAAGLSVTLAIASGGTNSTATATAGGIGYGTGTAHAYTAAGTSGQILQSNGASAPTWSTPGGPAFAVYMQNGGANYGTTSGTYTKVPFDTVEYDTNSNFSTTNKRFTPTVAGYYMFTATVAMNGPTDEIQVAIYKNGSIYKNNNLGSTSNSMYPSLPITHIMYMNGSTDYVEIYSYWHVGTDNILFGSANTFWSGCWLRS